MDTEKPRLYTIGLGGHTMYNHYPPDETCTGYTTGYCRVDSPEIQEAIKSGLPVVDLTTMEHDTLTAWVFRYPMIPNRAITELPPVPGWGSLDYLPDDAYLYLAQSFGATCYNFPTLTPARVAEIEDWHKKFLANRERVQAEYAAKAEERAREKEEQEKLDAEPCCGLPDAPSWGEVKAMAWDGIAEATDGCTVEPDGECIHGCKAWPRIVGIV